MKKKILITSVHMSVGGIESVLLHLLSSLDKDIYDIDLMLYKNKGELYKNIPKHVNVIKFYKENKLVDKIVNSDNIVFKIIKRFLFNKLTAKFWVTNKKYDVAISFSGYHTFMDFYTANVKANKKYIWMHTDFYWLYKNSLKFRFNFNLTKSKYKKFDKIIGVSEGVIKQFIKLMPNMESKIDYIWNPIIFNKSIDLKESKLLNGKYNIVSIGRLCKQKGFDRLIDVHYKLIQNGYDIKTYLIGDGKEKKKLENKVKRLNLTDNFIFLGKRTDIYSLLKESDLYVMTSYSEGLPTVLFESLVCNLPIVAPNVTGASDIYNYIAPKNSFILTDDNVESIYKGVIRAYNGEINNKFKFDYKEYNKKVIEKYEELLKR